MGPPSYMRSVDDRNAVTVYDTLHVVSLLSCPQGREIYRTASLSPPGHALTAAMFMDTIK